MAETTQSTLQDFLLPDLGEGLDEATIVSWAVAVGDRVELNQPLCDVETAKAEVEVPSPYAGTIVTLGGEEGETLLVGTLLARIETAPVDAGPGPVTRPEPTLVGYGHDEAIDRSRRPRRGSRPLATPSTRLLARQSGVDLSAVAPGSGPEGIVTRADVEAAAVPVTAPAPVAMPGTTVPVRGVRARIAERMATSRARIPDATCSVTADCTRLLEVRAVLNEHAVRRDLEPTVTPFSLLCRLVVQCLRDVPSLNAEWLDEGPAIRLHEAVHLGIGTATDRGLVVTVVRNAEAMAVHDLSSEMARLAGGARAGDLGPGDLTGSTFTISNFGALGLDEGVPIINHPEAAILGVGAIRRRPHVVDEEVVPRSTASLTLVFDHRVADGAEAGRFLSGLRDLVEAPERALL